MGQATDSYITGLNSPGGVALYDHHLYWANEGGYNSTGSIGRANLVGPLDVRQNFIPNTLTGSTSGYSQFCGIDVDGSGIYWADNNLNAIARANLDGSGVGVLIQGASSPCGVTLVGNHILWTNGASGTIGVALTSGADVNEKYITDQYQPCGLARYGGYLYWASNSHQWGGGTVERVALNSANPTADAETIVVGIASPCGVAVDGLFAGTLRVVSSKPVAGGVELSVDVSAPGSVEVQQATHGTRLIQRGTRTASRAGPVLLRLRLTAAGRRSVAKRRATGSSWL